MPTLPSEATNIINQIPSEVSDLFGKSNLDVATITAEGVGGFVSDIKIQEQATYTAIAPDIPVEDGSYIHDHIILEPANIKIIGQVAPYHFSKQAEKFTATPSQIVDTLSSFLPRKTTSQLRQVRNYAVNTIDTIDSYLTGFHNIFSGFKGDKTDLMQVFYDFMLEVRNKKILIDIKMPFFTFKNMVITSFVATTDNEANVLDYEIMAKNIVIAESIFSENIFKKGTRAINEGVIELQNVDEGTCNEVMPVGGVCK